MTITYTLRKPSNSLVAFVMNSLTAAGGEREGMVGQGGMERKRAKRGKERNRMKERGKRKEERNEER